MNWYKIKPEFLSTVLHIRGKGLFIQISPVSWRFPRGLPVLCHAWSVLDGGRLQTIWMSLRMGNAHRSISQLMAISMGNMIWQWILDFLVSSKFRRHCSNLPIFLDVAWIIRTCKLCYGPAGDEIASCCVSQHVSTRKRGILHFWFAMFEAPFQVSFPSFFPISIVFLRFRWIVVASPLWRPSGKRLQKAMENQHFIMGKSPINIYKLLFSIANCWSLPEGTSHQVVGGLVCLPASSSWVWAPGTPGKSEPRHRLKHAKKFFKMIRIARHICI